MEGTGSILKIKNLRDESETKSDLVRIYQDSIRFLSPREIANLHCFPNDFGKFY